ncbi:MAG: hypothetical protein NZ108_01420, partial [Bacteroidia bacterium]|nr:hypothetical protein [Bacteroidia bacterium]
NGKSYQEKNSLIRAEYEKVLQMPKEKVLQDLYRVRLTFSITKPASHHEVSNSIINSNQNLGWYRDNGYTDIALACVEYGITYCLFNYSLPSVTKELMQLFMQVLYPEYFQALGIQETFWDDKKLDGVAIKNKIGQIITTYKSQYPHLDFQYNYLKFGNLLDFAQSFSNELTYLNLNKA